MALNGSSQEMYYGEVKIVRGRYNTCPQK